MGLGIPRTYCARADIIMEDQEMRCKTFMSEDCRYWMDIGTKVLQRGGWRPECPIANERYLGRQLPPPQAGAEPSLVGAVTGNEWLSEQDKAWTTDRGQDWDNTILVEVERRSIGDIKSIASCMRAPGGVINT